MGEFIIVNAIIFGISGQDGYFLSGLLQKRNIEVIGVSRSYGKLRGDVADFVFVESVIKYQKPSYIFHFAANSTTRHDALFDNHNAISTGTLNILECVRLHCPAAKVFLSGSAMQFKNEGLPIDEKTPFAASSPYSVARIQSVYAGRYYRDTFGLQVYVGYFFNHDSPLSSEKHVNQKIVGSVKRIAMGSTENLELGNIDVKKEFNYAGDMVDAVWMLVNQDTVFEVVIGSGKAYSIKDWLEYCFKKINKNWQDFVEIKQNFVPEYKILVSNPELIKSIGWQPRVDFYQLADLMMGDL
jgi:GDPmannose 4,6-dehydratase